MLVVVYEGLKCCRQVTARTELRFNLNSYRIIESRAVGIKLTLEPWCTGTLCVNYIDG